MLLYIKKSVLDIIMGQHDPREGSIPGLVISQTGRGSVEKPWAVGTYQFGLRHVVDFPH